MSWKYIALLATVAGVLVSTSLGQIATEGAPPSTSQAFESADVTPAVALESPNPDDYDVIESAKWRTVKLQMDLSHGGQCDITLARPLPWLDMTGAKVGGTIDLQMPEMGIAGAAKVVAIEPCPEFSPPKPGSGKITGTFKTTNVKVIELSIEGSDKPIGTTASHPFWSLDRNGWVAAGDLKPGEKLRTSDGSATVKSVVPRPGTETVYNLEVHKNHTFFVSDAKLWVHNNCLSVNQINQMVRRGQAPRSIVRAELGREAYGMAHIHFSDGSALNIDGTWRHGSRILSNGERDFLKSIGWTLP